MAGELCHRDQDNQIDFGFRVSGRLEPYTHKHGVQ